ncbi:MAG: S9 family peptidase [Acidobacteriia bacterium]|nr:S9 family peptidase [Terriglobia bacterium]
MLRTALLLSLFAIPAAGLAVAQASETHPFTIHDMLAMDRISDPQASPDGKRIVFVVSVTDLDANKRRSHLWLAGTDGAGLRRMTSHEAGESSPRWATDGGSVFFLSSRGGSTQVWRIPVDGGEAEQATRQPLDVSAFLPSPDGKTLLVAMDVFPDDTVEGTKKRLDEIAARKSSGRIYDRLFIRHWDEWTDGRRSHLFAVPLAGGAPVDLMKGMDADCPGKPFGGVEEIAFSPDGKTLVFSARDAGREEAWSTNFDLFAVPLAGGATPRNLTADNSAWDTAPAFSPDGKALAYLAMKVPGYEADRRRIVVKAWPDGSARVLTEGWDRSPDTIFWSADGKTIYALAENLGQTALYAVDAASGMPRLVVEKGTVRSPVLAGDQIVYSLEHLRSPAEIYSVKPDGSDVRTVTRINAEKVAAARMGEPEQFSFKGWNGETVWGYVVKPADFDPGRKYPVAFLIHGGPQGSFGNDFHYRWNPQAYAGAGYAAVMVDFHGSTGYGQAFSDSIRGDWGGKPLEDLKKGLAAALERYPWMDGDRVAALGASFGGYMINWIAGNWPDRFRCLVSHDGNLDERAAYYDTEELWFPEHDHQGTPWSSPEAYEKQNPANFVKNWKTPILVVHSGKDFRVVETQGISTFTAAQRLGIPSKLLYFPDENHWVLKPANSLLWHETVLAWLDRWTRGDRK